MAIKIIKPTTAGQRKISRIISPEVKKAKIPKSLKVVKKRISGRNNQGKITIRHRGGGEKRFYRKVDFGRRIRDVVGKVVGIEYDPNRTANIALVEYEDGRKAYILAPEGLKINALIKSSDKAPVRIGNHMILRNIPIGTIIHNIEFSPGRGGSMVRSAGEGASLLSLEGGIAHIKLPSGEIRKVDADSRATIGTVGKADWSNLRIGKAGRVRHMGRRPQVRGKAMNPVDHAHGGGEGLSPIGLKYPKTPWGAPALGKKTRRKKRSDALIVKRR